MAYIRVKRLTRIAFITLKYYILYVLIFGFVIFGFVEPKKGNYIEQNSTDRFWGSGLSQDRAALVEGRHESWLARIDLINSAEETLDISYYTMHDGGSLDILLGCILDAADRGVEVRILLDGIFHNLRGSLKDSIYMLSDNPNIDLKFYEPLSLLKVWTWNNRLHDKMIIVDSDMAMIGGRNIGDKYFADSEHLDWQYDGFVVNDRDVVIINSEIVDDPNSGIYQMKEYYDAVWNHSYSRQAIGKVGRRQSARGKKMAKYLTHNLREVEIDCPQLFEPIDWVDRSVPTNKVTFIHNPIERMNKEPWCWYEIVNLAKEAEEYIFIQSPYILPTQAMIDIVGDIDELAHKAYILTNSIAINPNPMGSAGYAVKRKSIIDSGAEVYEFQGPGSIHAKSFMFDNRISLIGSFNTDARSAYLSTESMVVIDSEEFAEVLKTELQEHRDYSLLVGEDYSYIDNPSVKEEKVSLGKRLYLGFLSIVAYVFDFLL